MLYAHITVVLDISCHFDCELEGNLITVSYPPLISTSKVQSYNSFVLDKLLCLVYRPLVTFLFLSAKRILQLNFARNSSINNFFSRPCLVIYFPFIKRRRKKITKLERTIFIGLIISAVLMVRNLHFPKGRTEEKHKSILFRTKW